MSQNLLENLMKSCKKSRNNFYSINISGPYSGFNFSDYYRKFLTGNKSDYEGEQDGNRYGYQNTNPEVQFFRQKTIDCNENNSRKYSCKNVAPIREDLRDSNI